MKAAAARFSAIFILALTFYIDPIAADSRFGSLTHMHDPDMRGQDGQWVRPHPGPFIWGSIEPVPGEFAWQFSDKVVSYAQDHKQKILATIWPFANWEQQSCNRRKTKSPFGRRFPRFLSKPCSIDAYNEFLIKLIDRYDGDNKNDMPGLTSPIRYWEIMNEPEFEMFFRGSQQEFIDIFISSSKLIRKQQPGAKIVMAGAAGMMRDSRRFWDEVLPQIKNYFDIATVHHIAPPDGGCDRDLWVGEFAELLKKHRINKPIWVTEAQPTRSCGVVKSYVAAFVAGAEVIFDVGVRAPGRKMSKKDRQSLQQLGHEYDHFSSVSLVSPHTARFLFADGSEKILELNGANKSQSNQTGSDINRNQ